MRLPIACAALALLAGCGGSTSLAPKLPGADSSLATFLSRLDNTIATDLQQADALAVKTGDTIAHQCYPVLLDAQAKSKDLVTSLAGTQVGVFTTNEIARVVAPNGQFANQVMQTLEAGCAALVQDEQRLLNQAFTGFNLGILSTAAKLAPAA